MSDDADREQESYQALRIDHRKNDSSPELFVLTTSATELSEWAEVPRANPNFMDGYQRQLEDNRLNDIKDFLSNKNNIIPGAILVTVDEEYLTINEQNGSAEIIIDYPPERELKENLRIAYKNLYERLNNTGQEFVDPDEDSAEDSESEDNQSAENRSPVSYLARKTKQLKDTLDDFDQISDEEKQSLREYIKRVQKPGLIIDGQHRVHGAKKYQEQIDYPIVLIPGLEDREQVYHFYIINDKAEPISQEELLITVATALSEKESEELMDRLIDVGVDVDEARFPYLADVEDHSPFHNMVNYEEKVGEATGIIDFRTMYMLMNRFVEMKGGHNPLYDNIDRWYGSNANRYRIDKFYAFWTAIEEYYEDLWNDAKAAERGEDFEGKDFKNESPDQFFRKPAMRVFQEFILEELSEKQDNRQDFLDELDEDVRDELWEYVFEDDEVLKKEIKSVIDDVSEDFFRREWQTGGLSTAENRQNFREQLQKAANTTPKGLPQLRIFNKGF